MDRNSFMDGEETQTPLHQVFAMSKGDGESSYSQNSHIQAGVNKTLESPLTDALERVTLPDSRDAVVVADLGSSSGPNAIVNVRLIVDKLRLRLPKDTEFQAYFNDLPSNDFNQLFQLLSRDVGANGNLFAAGVPGSFYDRLFPRSRVNVFFSSFCLHWMSQIPDAVQDKNSPAYNRGNLWYLTSEMKSCPAVAAAYKDQSSLDLRNFLLAREAELQPGGLLFLSFLGRAYSDVMNPPVSDRCGSSKFIGDLNRVLNDLFSEGILAEELLDRFNFPMYLRSIEEVKEAIESYGGAFRVLTAKSDDVGQTLDQVFSGSTDQELVSRRANFSKSIAGGLMEAYLPKDVCGTFWQHYEKLLEKELSATRHLNLNSRVITVSLLKM